MKIKIFSGCDSYSLLEDEINNYIADKNVIDVNYTETWSDNYVGTLHGATVLYDNQVESPEVKVGCTCEDCPALKKMDELASQAEMFKKLIAEVTVDEILEAEKMARGGTD